MTRALVTQLVDALEAMETLFACHGKDSTALIWIDKSRAAIKAARAYLETEPSGERAELIARLAKQWAELDPVDPYRADIGKAVDMLEADAQQAKRVPMTDAEAHQTLLDMAANIEKFGDGTESNEQLSSECIRFILERVDHHGITPAEKPTDWSAA